MTTEHIYDGAHYFVDPKVLRSYGPQRHIDFTDNPSEVKPRQPRDEIRNYSKKNLISVQQGLKRLRHEERIINLWYQMAEPTNTVEEFVLNRKQLLVVEGDCSMGHHEWHTPTREQLKWTIDQAAPYFHGLARVDLYAALSGREQDIEFARRALAKKEGVLVESIQNHRDKANQAFKEIMAVPTKAPDIPQPSQPRQQGLLNRLWKRVG